MSDPRLAGNGTWEVCGNDSSSPCFAAHTGAPFRKHERVVGATYPPGDGSFERHIDEAGGRCAGRVRWGEFSRP